MTTYAVGDVHGCAETLDRLLDRIEPAPDDRLWFVGDLVNGGPDSAEVVRRVRDFGERATVVLGNHDLHMLAVACGAVEMREGDNFDDLLEAPDADELVDWLRHRPLLHRRDGDILVHAGLYPTWSIDRAAELAGEVEEVLRSSDWRDFLDEMYGNEPRSWDDELEGIDRLRVIVNATTRMRTVDVGRDRVDMRFDYSGELADCPEDRTPWFDVDDPAWKGSRIVFGHWSAIGYHRAGDVHALDSGCRWGDTLTAMRLDDEALFQVPSERPDQL